MRIENGVLVLNNGLKFKSIGVKSVKIGSEIKNHEVYKEDKEEEINMLQTFDYFCYDKETNKLYDLTFQNTMIEEEDNFVAALSYKI